ncbi:AI-2E family transporter [Zeaxanthinibacter sp. PT1]|nr:AI-2E family transporter [Zeaxanthinibacter sp. PT1]MDC6352092.1 AI-2E family transporter [Zeaxanthinibacter sp. PT1]
MLKPVVSFFERYLRRKIPSILFAYLVAVVPLVALILFFFNQSRILFGDLPSVRPKVIEVTTGWMDWLDQKFNLDPRTSSDWISENVIGVFDVPLELIRESFESGTIVIANAVLIILITYFMLLYRTSFKNYLLAQASPKNRKSLEQLFIKLQALTKRYMIGQGIIIIILGFLIGSGLWLIGVPYAYFWGFLAGFLEIIPYLGTTVGGILPFVYMLMVSDSLWQPWAVIGLYILVQQIEGNLISPNVMGPSIKINPLFIILGLFLGGVMWGISGMILALPVLAISKEVLRTFEVTEPFSYILEDGLSKKSRIFLDRYDDVKHRMTSLFFDEREEREK